MKQLNEKQYMAFLKGRKEARELYERDANEHIEKYQNGYMTFEELGAFLVQLGKGYSALVEECRKVAESIK